MKTIIILLFLSLQLLSSIMNYNIDISDDRKSYVINKKIITPVFSLKDNGEEHIYSIFLQNKIENLKNLIKENSIIKIGNKNFKKEGYFFLDASCSKCENYIERYDNLNKFSKLYFIIIDNSNTNKNEKIYKRYKIKFSKENINKIFSKLGIRKIPTKMVLDNKIIYYIKD